jgi:hypothetical protein
MTPSRSRKTALVTTLRSLAQPLHDEVVKHDVHAFDDRRSQLVDQNGDDET